MIHPSHLIRKEMNQTILFRTLGLALMAAMGVQSVQALGADTLQTQAQSAKPKVEWPAWMPHVSGTIRGKWEWQTEKGESRFEVRTARLAVDGKITPSVEYKAEIDLSDEGQIKMLDAYAGILPMEGMGLRIGQMRVPFSIDAHRSPHKQYFANRSFIAKQVGNVRDVGVYAGYASPTLPLIVEAGAFNGSGLTNQKNFWTKEFNFSAKVQVPLPCGLTLESSVQKVSPNGTAVYLYDAGATFQKGRFTIEAEYLRKHYTHDAFPSVNAVDAFVCYDQPLKHVFRKVSLLCRYDMMDDHSDGTLDENGQFKLTDAKRHRITPGVTLSLAKKMDADIRLNYEKYFYDDTSLAKPSERDKAVVELVVHF